MENNNQIIGVRGVYNRKTRQYDVEQVIVENGNLGAYAFAGFMVFNADNVAKTLEHIKTSGLEKDWGTKKFTAVVAHMEKMV